MPDYKKMYATLFNKITNVIEGLKEVQLATEEIYINSSDPPVKIAPADDTEELSTRK